VSERILRQIVEDLGDLLGKHTASRAADFTTYRNDPVGFIRDMLGGKPWPKQIETAEAVRDEAQVTVRSCHAAGKDWLAARLALWWVYCRRGLVVLTGPTASQVEEILMRKEVLTAFRAGGLPGELHVKALRPGGSGEAGILARTGTGVHGLTGLHEARVLFVITEAQDPDIAHAWDAAFACTTGAGDRILTLGNPTEPDGRFYRAHQPGSGWRAIKIEAADIPNVQEGRTVVPGLLTQEGVERFIREYGEGSPFVISRVHAEFPAEATDSLVTVDWLDRAVELHRTRAFEYEATRSHHVLGVDPARLGPDKTVVCVRQASIVREFVEWRGLDTMATADRVQVEVRRLLEFYAPSREGGAVESVHVDEIGLGGGVLDRLRETLPRVRWAEYMLDRIWPSISYRSVEAVPFNAARASGLPERFANLRAQAYWFLRKLLEDSKLALPDLAALREELLATRVRFGADGRTSIESKDAVKDRIGRSPDYSDALVISLAPMLPRVGGRKRVWSATR
jgi:phage terminase large subunit